MKILGIDPGFGLCGFAVLESREKSNPELKTFGVISTKPQTNFAKRLIEIADDIEHLLEKYQPDIVSIEDLFFAKNVTTGLQVAQVRGIIIYLAKKFGCQIIEPKPVEVKSSFTGNGKATKSEMKKMAKMMFHLKQNPQIDDAADAIAVALFATQRIHQI
jgi:crossover junction endodeoxyribonuclease RuvC